MALLAKLTGFSKRWVIELMKHVEMKSFIPTDGGSGALKRIWLLPLGVPRLGRPFPTELTKKARAAPGESELSSGFGLHTKRRRKEMAQSSKPGAEGNVANGGDSRTAPERTDARRSGIRQPRGAGHYR
jgi:hypothetical protein